jgi:hypothetical protein
VERRYAFAQQLLVSENVLELLKAVPGYIKESFGATQAAVYVPTKDQSYRSDPERQAIPTTELREVAAHGEIRVDPQRGVASAPLRMGTRTEFNLTGKMMTAKTRGLSVFIVSVSFLFVQKMS